MYEQARSKRWAEGLPVYVPLRLNGGRIPVSLIKVKTCNCDSKSPREDNKDSNELSLR